MSPEVVAAAGVRRRLSARLDPVRPDPDRLAGTQDLRSIGSGNIGATNVLRTGRKGLAAATLLCDMLKGTVAVIIAGYYGGPDAAMLAALGAFLGHLFPVWLNFKGGKGVAVYIGVLLGLFWPAAMVFCVLWLATAVISRYSSLSALVASFVTPIFLWWFGHPALAALFAVLTVLLFYMHRENIKRLQAGTEGRIGKKTAIAVVETVAKPNLHRIDACLNVGGRSQPPPLLHPSRQRRFDEARGPQRAGVVAKSRDHLHAHRQTALGDIGGNVDAGHAHQRPEPVEPGIAGRGQALRRRARRREGQEHVDLFKDGCQRLPRLAANCRASS